MLNFVQSRIYSKTNHNHLTGWTSACGAAESDLEEKSAFKSFLSFLMRM